MERKIKVELVEKLIFIFGGKALDSVQHDHGFSFSTLHKLLSQPTFEGYFIHPKM